MSQTVQQAAAANSQGMNALRQGDFKAAAKAFEIAVAADPSSGALLRNLDKRLRDETGLPVLIAENPLTSVVLGAGRMLTDLALLRKVALD